VGADSVGKMKDTLRHDEQVAGKFMVVASSALPNVACAELGDTWKHVSSDSECQEAAAALGIVAKGCYKNAHPESTAGDQLKWNPSSTSVANCTSMFPCVCKHVTLEGGSTTRQSLHLRQDSSEHATLVPIFVAKASSACPNGSAQISNSSQCENAASIQGYAWGGQVTWQSITKNGCIWGINSQTGDATVWFQSGGTTSSNNALYGLVCSGEEEQECFPVYKHDKSCSSASWSEPWHAQYLIGSREGVSLQACEESCEWPTCRYIVYGRYNGRCATYNYCALSQFKYYGFDIYSSQCGDPQGSLQLYQKDKICSSGYLVNSAEGLSLQACKEFCVWPTCAYMVYRTVGGYCSTFDYCLVSSWKYRGYNIYSWERGDS